MQQRGDCTVGQQQQRREAVAEQKRMTLPSLHCLPTAPVHSSALDFLSSLLPSRSGPACPHCAHRHPTVIGGLITDCSPSSRGALIPLSFSLRGCSQLSASSHQVAASFPRRCRIDGGSQLEDLLLSLPLSDGPRSSQLLPDVALAEPRWRSQRMDRR